MILLSILPQSSIKFVFMHVSAQLVITSICIFPNRLHQSLMRFVNTVPIPPNSTNNTLVFALNNFALLLRDVNPESFSGESLSVNLGPVEEVIRNSSGINEEAFVTMMDPLLNATASAKLPESLFNGITTYASPWQQIVYSVFLTNALFLTLDTDCGDSVVGSIILPWSGCEQQCNKQKCNKRQYRRNAAGFSTVQNGVWSKGYHQCNKP